ncbi:MAG: hypothetical protein V4463_01740 [Pseudomonadota bacterium]
MKKITHLLAGLLLIGLSHSASSMIMAREGDTLVMTGKVIPEDLDRFRRQLVDGTLRLVVLAESPGGDLRAALWIAHRINEHKINTAVLGHCASSCAVIFMGGIERQMMDTPKLERTRLGFHGPHKKSDHSVSERGSETTRAWLVEASQGKFDGPLLDRAMNIQKAEDIMFFYYPREGSAVSTWFCKAGAKPRPRGCDEIAEVDLFKAGILTTPKLLAMDTPIGRAAAEAPPAKDAGEAADPAPAAESK